MVINPLYPHLGASPDGVITCDCCGRGVLEIKCPYNARAEPPSETIDCLLSLNGELHLNTSHAYYYQVQSQMYICKAQFADFVVWTIKGLFIEHIKPDNTLFNHVVGKINTFYISAVLSEVIGKWYTRRSVITGATSCESQQHKDEVEETGDKEWCYYCRLGDDVDDLIQCDNPSCHILWFHLTCIEIKHVPKGKWYCPDCRQQFV